MHREKRSYLGTLAIIGIVLFIVTNWWPLFTGREETGTVAETKPTVAKEAAAAAAEAFVAKLDGSPAQSEAVVYQSEKLLSGYIKKEKWEKEYTYRFQDRVPIDFYQVYLTTERGFQFIADVDMKNGAVIGWRMRSKEAAPRQDEGRRLAESYLRDTGFAMADYSYVRSGRSASARFDFEHRTEKLGDARLVAVVEVSGGKVVGFRQEFRIPADHLAWIDQQDRAAESMTTWNLIISLLMGIAAIVIAIVNRKRTAFSRGLLLGTVFLAIYIIQNFNMLPAYRTALPEGSDPFLANDSAFVSVIIMNVVVLIMGVVLYVSLVAGLAMWNSRGIKVWPRWREPEFGDEAVGAMIRGYGLACFMLGLQSLLFFTAEQRFGMWSVNDPMSSMYNLLTPALFPTMAWAAAISEEAIYRFFGIALFQRLLRSTFLAVLVPSMIWAFSHTQYPIYPVYTRFVEVTVLGIIFGYAFLKYGFMTTLFAHATMNTLLMSFSLISMGGAANGWLGLLYIVSPAAIALALRWLHRKAGRTRRIVDDSI